MAQVSMRISSVSMRVGGWVWWAEQAGARDGIDAADSLQEAGTFEDERLALNASVATALSARRIESVATVTTVKITETIFLRNASGGTLKNGSLARGAAEVEHPRKDSSSRIIRAGAHTEEKSDKTKGEKTLDLQLPDKHKAASAPPPTPDLLLSKGGGKSIQGVERAGGLTGDRTASLTVSAAPLSGVSAPLSGVSASLSGVSAVSAVSAVFQCDDGKKSFADSKVSVVGVD